MMKKGIRIIEHMLRVDKVSEEAGRLGDERALGCPRDQLFIFPTVEWWAVYGDERVRLDNPIR
jgi:hypothetical protein